MYNIHNVEGNILAATLVVAEGKGHKVNLCGFTMVRF